MLLFLIVNLKLHSFQNKLNFIVFLYNGLFLFIFLYKYCKSLDIILFLIQVIIFISLLVYHFSYNSFILCLLSSFVS